MPPRPKKQRTKSRRSISPKPQPPPTTSMNLAIAPQSRCPPQTQPVSTTQVTSWLSQPLQNAQLTLTDLADVKYS
jgi:hypothetical protein